MFVVSVTIFVKTEFIPRFIQATLDNSRNTREEPGNVRFDVLQAETDPGRFLLYEAYQSKDDFTRHQQTPHYLKWKETVADFMSKPREGIKHFSLAFRE